MENLCRSGLLVNRQDDPKVTKLFIIIVVRVHVKFLRNDFYINYYIRKMTAKIIIKHKVGFSGS